MMLPLKFVATVLTAWAGITNAAPVDTESSALVPRASYASVSGTLFNIDGTTQYIAGSNAYWLAFLTSNTDVDTVFTHFKASGLKVLRIWGFNDVSSATSDVWFQSFSGSTPTINTGTNGLQRLDYVVSSAEAHGVKLIINFVNNWSDYGGMPLYNTFYGTTKATWYTNTNVQTQYKAYINAVVSRYKTSTAVLAWELANEARCNGCATSVITNWATTISAYIKSLDSNHLVTLGDEGFMNGGGDGSYPYTAGEGVDWVANLKIPNLDFATFHLYPGSWGETNDWGNAWITNHAAACVAANKPCLFEEYGTPSNHVAVETPWQQVSLATKGIAGDMFWQYGDTLSNGQTSDDGNTIYYGSSEWTSLVTDHVASISGSSQTTVAASTSTTKPTTSTSTTKPASTTTSGGSTTTTSASGSGSAAHYAQCGGNNWTGPTTCVSPYTCTYSNAWYSQCL
jgi:mannan endo-1,4-beta-mannosidase